MTSSVPGQTPTKRWGEADDGAVLEVSVPAGTEGRLEELWPAMGLGRRYEAGPSVERSVVLRSGVAGTPAVEVDGEPSFGGWDRVESELALFAAERLAGLVAVHAAAIAAEDRVLLVPGATGAGKSRLCVAAAEQGAVVLSDEYALVDPEVGTVRGWQRPVRVRRPDGGVDRLDLTQRTEPMPVGLVALVLHDPGRGLAVEDLAPARATLGILANTVCARSRPEESLDAVLQITRSCPTVTGTRGEADEAIRELLAMMHSR